MARGDLKIAVLDIIRATKEDHPLTVDEIHKLLAARGIETTRGTVQTTLYSYREKGDDGYQYVHKVSLDPKSRLSGYYWDTGKTAVVKKEGKVAKRNLPVKPPQPEQPKFGRVIDVPEHGFMLIIDSEGNVIKGRRMVDE